MKKLFTIMLVVVIFTTATLFAEGTWEMANAQPVKIDVLILPKFETNNMSGDFPGEAQLYYEEYVMGGDEYEIAGNFQGNKLYVKDGIALYVTGVGKVNTAISLVSIITDQRFDFSEAYFFSTGCCGSSAGDTTMGDVFIISAVADFDLGHHADVRDMEYYDENTTTWYPGHDSSSYRLLNQDLVTKVYDLVKDVEIKGTPKTRAFMAHTFDNAAWATRDPKIMKGTGVTGDNYWKGIYDENNARAMTAYHRAPDPFVCTEMEDVALAVALDRFGYLDRYFIIRDSVNMDVWMNGLTPEILWGGKTRHSLASEDSIEAADIFFTARYNNFNCGKVVVDAIKNGTF